MLKTSARETHVLLYELSSKKQWTGKALKKKNSASGYVLHVLPLEMTSHEPLPEMFFTD